MIILAALALMAGAAFFAQVLRPTSMVAAMIDSEWQAMLSPSGGPGGVAWNDVRREFEARRDRHPKKLPHDAMATLLYLAEGAARGDAAAQVEQRTRQTLSYVADNELARLVAAFVFDATRARAADLSAAQRYQQIRAVLEGDAPATHASLYNEDFRALWHDVLRDFFRRPDVAASLSTYAQQYPILSHSRVLPLVVERVARLADALADAGDLEAARYLRRSMARMLLDLIAAEPDTGTRMLCVDILADHLAPDPTVADTLRRLRTDHHAAAAQAPIDLSGAFIKTRSLVPAAYHRATLFLGWSAAALILGGGAAFGAVIALLLHAGGRGRAAVGGQSAADAFRRRRALVFVFVGVLAGSAIAPMLFYQHGPFSPGWAVLLVLGMLMIGGLAAMVAFAVGAGRTAGPAALVRSTIGLSAALVFLMLPPYWLTWAWQAISTAFFPLWALLPATALVVIAGTIVTPGHRLRQAQVGLVVAALAGIFSLVSYAVHERFDRRYQQAVVAAHADPMAARLGDDWAADYLGPLCETYDLQTP